MLAAYADSAPVLISGASGTGKGAIAKWIHLNSPRSTRTYHLFNSKTDLRSQILECKGGSLVLPEITALSNEDQKILGEFLRTHALRHPETDVHLLANTRILALTELHLDPQAKTGLFNVELMNRLHQFHLKLPPLCERIREFEDITMGLLSEITREAKKEYLRTLSEDAWNLLKTYDWPGNIRELRNVLMLAVAHSKGEQITREDLPEFQHHEEDFLAGRTEFEKTYFLEVLKMHNGDLDKASEAVKLSASEFSARLKAQGTNLSVLRP